MLITSYFLAAIILCWSEVIGPEEIIVQERGGPKVAAGRIKLRKSIASFDGSSRKIYKRPSIAVSVLDTVDKERFIASFRRQARLGLLSCLHENLPSPNSILLSARLYRTGALRRVGAVNASRLPGCAQTHIAQMNFVEIFRGMDNISWVAIQWIVKW